MHVNHVEQLFLPEADMTTMRNWTEKKKKKKEGKERKKTWKQEAMLD